MASSSSTAASTSTAVSLDNYDVFINHRGPDVKKTFASYLYRRLVINGLRVFLDQQEFQQGEDLIPQIHGAIKTASVHIAIFSPTYAESSWCLEELVLMLETGATILPVFYNVKPSELRWNQGETGRYAEALRNLKNKKRYDSGKLKKWREALFSLANKSGFELAKYNGDKGKLLDRVIERVLRNVEKLGLEVAKYPTGLDDKIQDFENTVLKQRQSGKPQILGIVGLGGVGKTTLAKELFNRKKSDYGRSSCFLYDVRDKAAKGTLHLLQAELMNSLIGQDRKINNVDEGIRILRNHLSFSKALIVLDDVDDVKQVDAFLPVGTVIHSDTLVLITSRNRAVLIGSKVEESAIYDLSGLNEKHSLELFCLHSFNQAHPLPGFEDLGIKFSKACDGLPLSLIVFGALVYGNDDPSYWEEQLDRLKEILPTEIKQKLQISYDAVGVQEQHIFLDIACFFIGKDMDMAVEVWDGSGWKGRLGFRNIENRCLVKVDSKNCIHMHDHLRDLGRDLAKAPGLPLRLWRGMENISQQLSDEQVIREVRGIRMIGENNDTDDQFACFSWCQSWSHGLFRRSVMKLCNILHNRQARFHGIRMRNLQLLDAKDEDGLLKALFQSVEFPNLLWLRWKGCPYSSLPSWTPLKNLRVLQMESDQLETLWQKESQAPLQLRVLEISSPLSRIPKSIGQLKHLQRIVVHGGRQVTIPEEFCDVQSLKFLELVDCREMKLLPDRFGSLINLQHIDLRRCRKLERLPDSFGNLTSLKYLGFAECNNLAISSNTFGNIKTLEQIVISQSGEIKVLPPEVAHQKSMERLILRCLHLKELPSAIGELSELEVLELKCYSLEELPPSLTDLWNLKELSLNCAELKCLPPSLGDLRKLKKLSLLSCTKLKCLPSSARLLTQLTELVIRRCPALSEVPFEMVEGERETLGASSSLDSSIEQCMPRLQSLELCDTKISKLSFSAGVCPNLQYLQLERCYDLVEIGTLPNTLVTLSFGLCINLRKIKGLCGLPNLQRLHIYNCREVEELPSVETLISLEELQVWKCQKVKSIGGLGQLTKLKTLLLYGCEELEELAGIEDVRSLVEVDVSRCPKVQWKGGVVEQLQQRGVKVHEDCFLSRLMTVYFGV